MFLEAYKPQILCLNETKIYEDQIGDVKKHLAPYFDTMLFACCSVKANYGGVAILYNKAAFGQ